MFFESLLQRLLWVLQFFFVSVCSMFQNIFLDLDFFMMALWSFFGMTEALLTRMYFSFIGTY